MASWKMFLYIFWRQLREDFNLKGSPMNYQIWPYYLELLFLFIAIITLFAVLKVILNTYFNNKSLLDSNGIQIHNHLVH